MTQEHLMAFNLVLMAAIASPGAALLVAVRTTVASGRAAGMATGAGLALMASGWTLAALLGLDAVFALFPWLYGALKTGGALYLLYLALRLWRGARSPLGEAPTPRGRAFLRGLLVNLGNPKSMLFAAAVIVVVFPRGLGAGEIAFITANHLVLELAFYTLFATALSSAPARARYLRAKPFIDRIAALLLAGLGLKLLLQRTLP
ncbi:LysE family translocator [Sulfitobacter sabulilitoris]|uniref:LysE family translocator n=1 Tax=Sulfitobacter sabulilitoris TaxID=2562655 RepID=A0A5S3QCL8_9RHOB|nr:LysE family translocator [Sulfitobacter sabulilitoris]TMM54862.1 LysE family translocator [Sulfitobacter sabulilitoris]